MCALARSRQRWLSSSSGPVRHALHHLPRLRTARSLSTPTVILGALWLAEGVLTARVATSDDLTTCDALFATALIQLCNEMNAIVGVAFTTWIICERPFPQ